MFFAKNALLLSVSIFWYVEETERDQSDDDDSGLLTAKLLVLSVTAFG